MPTRTTPRSTPAAGRFGRSQAPAGRMSRAAAHRPATRRSTPSTRVPVRRKPAQRSKSDKALSGLVGMLPGSVLGKAAKPSAASGGKGRKAGFALLAGAAGLALKNRDKMPGRRKTEEPVVAAPAPVTGEYTTPVPANDAAPTTPPAAL